MKLDKGKRTVVAMLCLYICIGIVAVLLFARYGSKTSRLSNQVQYTFEDDGKAGAAVEVSGINVIGESGALEEPEPTPEITPEVTPEPTPEPLPDKVYYKFKVTTSIHHLRVRKEPDMDATILYYFEKGEEGYILENLGEWSLVTDGTRVGYCSNEYLNLTELTKDELPDFFPEEYK